MWFDELLKRRADLSQEDISRLILQNSMRLYRDTKYLRKDGRHQSALTLLILSIEELGKFMDYQGKTSARSTDKRLHMKRQLTAACAFMHFFVESVCNYLFPFKRYDRFGSGERD
jgi:hypothetical protein